MGSTQISAVNAPGRVETFILFGGMAEAGPKEITMDDLWCVAEIRDESDTLISRRWRNLVPLSSKTKTWFPDNDADSSDEEEAPKAPGKQNTKQQSLAANDDADSDGDKKPVKQ